MKRIHDRRRFLGRLAVSAGAACAPAVVPSSALGTDGAVAPSEKITIGCVGVGGMGTANMFDREEANRRLSRPMHNGWSL